MTLVHIAVATAVWLAYAVWGDAARTPRAPGTAPARPGSFLEFVPELKSVAARVVDAAPPNQEMNARAVAAAIERFARGFYRAAGKARMTACEKTRVLGDLHHAREDAIEGMRELYFASRRETHRKKLDACNHELAYHTETAIRTVRKLIGNPNEYTPGRGFPVGASNKSRAETMMSYTGF